MPELVHALQNTLGRPFRHGRHGVVFVAQGDVILNVFTRFIHPANAVLDDDRHLVGEGRIVRQDVGNRRRKEMAMAIFMLKAFAIERGPAGGGAQQEAAHCACRPPARPDRRFAGSQTSNNRCKMGSSGRRALHKHCQRR